MNEIKKDKNYALYLSGLIDEDELMRRISLYEMGGMSADPSKLGGISADPSKLDDPVPGLEGPFTFLSGKTLYYDPKEGKYYDRGSDMYVDDNEMQHHLYPQKR